MAPKSLFWVYGFLCNLSKYFIPVKMLSLALNLAFKAGVVEQPQRTGVEFIEYALLHFQQERLALVHKNLRDVLVHEDGTLDGFLGNSAIPGSCLGPRQLPSEH